MKNKEFKYFPGSALTKLEFTEVLEIIRANCISELGQKQADVLSFSEDIEHLKQQLIEIEEFKHVLFKGYNYPLTDYISIEKQIQILQISNAVLSLEDAIKIYQFTQVLARVNRFLNTYAEEIPELFRYSEGADELIRYLDLFKQIFTKDYEIADDASPELKEIRQKIAKKESQISKHFSSCLKEYSTKGYLADEKESVRQGQRVLAIHSKFKRSVSGIVVDESATGQTSFVVPTAVLEARNAIANLKNAEKKEIYKILSGLSEKVRPSRLLYTEFEQKLGQLDFIRAKAKFANDIQANMPKLSNHPVLFLQDARHPLLLLKNKQLNKPTVPLSLSIGKAFNILLLSGPNAGGKSVCLKTIGLIQLMIQAGIQIPADKVSEVGIFNKILVDMGDDQSINDDLSTYSSHLSNMRYFIENVDAKSIILIDEFGSGTDPDLGGQIAEGLLEALLKKGAKGVVSTHYSNLKQLAARHKDIQNAAMLFDAEKLKPSYRLEIGKPGSSYAFELLKLTGFTPDILKDIQSKIDHKSLKLEELLSEIQKEKEALSALKATLENEKSKLNDLVTENEALKQDISKKRNDIIDNSKIKAEAYLNNLNRRFEKLVKEISSLQGSKAEKQQDQIKKLRQSLHEEKSKLQKYKSKQQKRHKQVTKPKIPIETGSIVTIKGGKESGEVVKLNNNIAEVIFGHFKTRIGIDELEVVSNKKGKKEQQVAVKYTLNENQSFNPILDIRGARINEAQAKLDDFIDLALRHNFKDLKIIHGRGNGVLRELVRSALKKYSFIGNIHSESEQNGGDGATCFELT